jgi:hypothetical protein
VLRDIRQLFIDRRDRVLGQVSLIGRKVSLRIGHRIEF